MSLSSSTTRMVFDMSHCPSPRTSLARTQEPGGAAQDARLHSAHRHSQARPMSATALPPGFNRLAWSNLAAQSAEQVGLAAAPIVAVLAFGAGAGETGLLQTAQTLPFLLLAIPAGVLADRMSRRKLMAAAEA